MLVGMDCIDTIDLATIDLASLISIVSETKSKWWATTNFQYIQPSIRYKLCLPTVIAGLQTRNFCILLINKSYFNDLDEYGEIFWGTK
jgi:hypothetical protein